MSARSPAAAHGGDERYIVVAGRRWRRSDPAIPEALRSELVHELMDARRAVRAAQLAANGSRAKAARARVQDAKLALGERGRPYWQTPDATAQRARAAATIRALLTRRNVRGIARDPGLAAPTICPSDVARVIGGQRWRSCMRLVRDVAAELATRGQLRVLQRGHEVSLETARGPVRLAQDGAAIVR